MDQLPASSQAGAETKQITDWSPHSTCEDGQTISSRGLANQNGGDFSL
jgi:hypothetical protein